LAVEDRQGTGSGTRGWRTAVTGGVLVWLAVKAAVAVLAVLVPATRGGRSVTDPAGLAVPDAADGFSECCTIGTAER